MKKLYGWWGLVQFLVHASVQSECTLGCTSCGVTNDLLLSNNHLQGSKSKYVTMQLNIFVNFIQTFELDVIWLEAKGPSLNAPQRILSN